MNEETCEFDFGGAEGIAKFKRFKIDGESEITKQYLVKLAA